jgi:hypothetical protein
LFVAELTGKLTNIPLFTSDELGHYMVAIWETYRLDPDTKWNDFPFSERSRLVNPELDYAVFHKERAGSRVIRTEKVVIFGDETRIRERLKGSPSKTINTAFIERINGTLRQYDGHLHRKSQYFAKDIQFFRHRLAIAIAYYNFVKPHGTLSRNADMSYVPRTPAQVKGLTDCPWTIEEILGRPVITTII